MQEDLRAPYNSLTPPHLCVVCRKRAKVGMMQFCDVCWDEATKRREERQANEKDSR